MMWEARTDRPPIVGAFCALFFGRIEFSKTNPISYTTLVQKNGVKSESCVCVVENLHLMDK